MNFKIDNQIFEKYPELNIGVVLVRGIDNQGESKEIMAMIKNKSEEIKENYTLESLKQDPKIIAWQEAFRTFGAKPKKHSSSIENLYRMVLEGVELRHINKLVDIYNFISLKHMVPVGGDDIDKIEGGITLRLAKGDENFTRLNSNEMDHPKEGEVIYADDKEVLCRRWNWRECDKSKMTAETKNVMLVVEGLPPVTKQDVQEIITELADLMKKYCGGTTEVLILNSK